MFQCQRHAGHSVNDVEEVHTTKEVNKLSSCVFHTMRGNEQGAMPRKQLSGWPKNALLKEEY